MGVLVELKIAAVQEGDLFPTNVALADTALCQR